MVCVHVVNLLNKIKKLSLSPYGLAMRDFESEKCLVISLKKRTFARRLYPKQL